MRLRFFNTFETVSPHFRQLLPHLSARGHEVEAVIARSRYREGAPSGHDGYRVRAVPAWKPADLRTKSGKLALYSSYAAFAAGLSLLGPGTDLNVFFTQPPLFPAWGRVLRALRQQPYMQIVMDLYPWVAMQAGAFPSRGQTARAAKAIARQALCRAVRVVVIGRCMRDRVEALGVPAERIHLIRNWADCGLVRPVPLKENRLRRKYGIGERFVVMYSGNLGLTHSFDELLAVAARMKDRSDVLFLVVGGGRRLREVEAAVRDRDLSNCRILGFRPHEDLADSLSAADVHYASLRPGFEGLVVPSKAYGALAAGRPVIYQGDRSGEIARMVEEEDVGFVVDPGDVDGLHDALLRAAEDRDWCRQTGDRARMVAEARYDARRGLGEFDALFDRLAEGGAR
jgi:glycosyltransferase involved in cell wall biosynthesis